MQARLHAGFGLVMGAVACTPGAPATVVVEDQPTAALVQRPPPVIPTILPTADALATPQRTRPVDPHVTFELEAPKPLLTPRITIARAEDLAPVKVELGTDFSRFYPGKLELGLVELTSEDRILILRFRSDRPGFRGVAYGALDSLGFQPERGMSEGRIAIDVDAEPTTSDLVYWFEAVDEDGARSEPRLMGISFYPPERYAESGWTSPGVITLDWSDVPWSTSTVDDWILDEATDEDRAFAEATWGETVHAQDTTEAKVRALNIALLDALDQRWGVPTPEMTAQAPLEQYRRAAAGLDQVWCDNFAKIFLRAASCFGIQARRIEMAGKELSTAGATLLSAEGHATTEYFDPENNRWVWIDLTASVLGARRSNGLPLNLAGFQRLLNDPDGDPIALERYYPDQGGPNVLMLDPANPRIGLRRLFNPDQRFIYYMRPPDPTGLGY